MPVRHPTIARKRLRTGVLIALVWVVLGTAASPGSAESGDSDDYIVGFVRYVHWPDEDAARAWTVCVAGLGANERDARYANERVRNKPFAWRAVEGAQELEGCHVLDLTRADKATTAALLAQSRGRPLLSVGRGAEFCTAGGLICLHEPGDERAFEVNLSAIKESGLGVSARLLRLGAGHAPQDGTP
jgi:hypothetical protein